MLGLPMPNMQLVGRGTGSSTTRSIVPDGVKRTTRPTELGRFISDGDYFSLSAIGAFQVFILSRSGT